MKMNKKHLFFILVVLLFFVLVPVKFSNAQTPDSPTIISIEQMGGPYLNRPLIKGLTPANTEVMVYIDGIYMGEAHINEENTATNNFYFQGIEAISAGEHYVSAVAKDKTSLTLSSFSNEIMFHTGSKTSGTNLPAPTLIEPNEDTVTGSVKPLIKGLTFNNTLVHVFIDGVYNGKTQILNHASGVANFAYQPFLNLSIGEHVAWVVAEEGTGRKSGNSNVLYFKIEQPLPAPVLYSPVVNINTTKNKPFIVGLAKNDLTVNVYIDHKLNGRFSVDNHPSGTANFAFQPFSELASGNHLVYAVAVDSRGKESRWSNPVYFNVAPRAYSPSIGGEAAVEEPIVKSDEDEYVDEIDEIKDFEEINVEPDEISEEETVSDDLKEILEIPEEEAGITGSVNESEEQQGKLKLNLIIFILFLVAIIIWIFWVNRELIKERRAQGEEEDRKEDKKLPKLDL